MKICIITLNRYGGTLKCASRLVDAFPKEIELKLFVSKQANHDLLPQNKTYISIKTGSNKYSNLICSLNPFNYQKILSEIKTFNPDVIHFPIEHAWNFVLLLALKNYPIVQTIHDPVRHLGEENYFYDYLRHLAINRADRIIVLSNQFQKSFKRYGISKSRVDVIPHGTFSFAENTAEPPLNKKILFAGRINKYKGLDVLLKAFLIILQKHPDAQLIIAGKGDLGGYYELIESIKNLTIINKYLSEQELKELHNNCDFVVAPYIQASQSGVVATAAASGRAVIASNVGGISEQIINNKTGILVGPSNVNQLSNALIDLLENPQKILEMGKNASEEYKMNFSWDKIAQETLNTYLKAMDAFRLKRKSRNSTTRELLYSAYKSYRGQI